MLHDSAPRAPRAPGSSSGCAGGEEGVRKASVVDDCGSAGARVWSVAWRPPVHSSCQSSVRRVSKWGGGVGVQNFYSKGIAAATQRVIAGFISLDRMFYNRMG